MLNKPSQMPSIRGNGSYELVSYTKELHERRTVDLRFHLGRLASVHGGALRFLPQLRYHPLDSLT